MSQFFTNLRDGVGKRLLTKYGEEFRITKSSDPVFNPSTGAVTSSTTTQDVVGKSFSKQERYAPSELTQNQEVEIFLTASDISFAPEVGMTIRTPAASGAEMRITRVMPIPQSGTVVMYQLVASR